MKKSKTHNKINQQSMTMFEYYINQLFPHIFKGYSKHLSKPLNLHTQSRNISYHYICDSVEIQHDVSPLNALSAAQGLYYDVLAFKLDQFRGVKESKIHMKLIPYKGVVVDQIDLLVPTLDDEVKDSSHLGLSRQSFKENKNSTLFRSFSTEDSKKEEEKKSPKSELFQLYVIHHSQGNKDKNQLQWLNYIERYNFIQQPNESGELTNYIIYQAVMTKHIDDTILTIDFNDHLLRQYFEETCKLDKKGHVRILEDMSHQFQLVQTQDLRACQEELEKQCFDPKHRRSLSLPSQYRTVMQKLNGKATSLHKEFHPDEEESNFFLQNLVCRMMQNNNFKENSSWQAIEHYLTYFKNLREKYTWDSFKEERSMNMFNYLGKDFMGRPVVLNTVRNIRFSQIKDKDKFIDFQFYFYGVYLRQKMVGWVDEFDAIFDAGDQTADNTDMLVTRNVACEAYRLVYGQSRYVTAFNVGNFTKLFTKLLFPLLPKQLVQTINLYGDDSKEIANKLREQMSNEVIPDFLGGQNHHVFEESHKALDLSYFQRSFLPFR